MTPAASILAFTLPCDVTSTTNWNARFGVMFDEYRVIGVRVHAFASFITNATNTNAPCWFDEQNQAAPTLAEAREKDAAFHLPMNPYVNKEHHSSWNARDLNDLGYTPVGTSFVPVTFKAYTDVNFGTIGGATAPLGSVRIEYLVGFRGLKAS
jgi:hypothetical protein